MVAEMGTQALVADQGGGSVSSAMEKQVWEIADEVLRRAGVSGEIQHERQRAIHPPMHDSTEFPDCPYAQWVVAHPGADITDYTGGQPLCHGGDHWFKEFVGWEFNAWGETND